MAKDAKTIVLCSVRFWANAGFNTFPPHTIRTTATLRKGARKVARSQGLTPAQIDKAERELLKRGYIRYGKDNHTGKVDRSTIALTDAGKRVSRKACYRVELKPWDWGATYHGLEGRRPRRRRSRR